MRSNEPQSNDWGFFLAKMKSLLERRRVKPASPRRFPLAAAGIQVNHCRNPKCANFGVVPKETVRYGRAGVKVGQAGPGDYRVVASGANRPDLSCLLCGEQFPIQSNLAIAEELLRISRYLNPAGPRCTNPECPEPDSQRVIRYGVNAHGNPRYRCTHCLKTFTFGGRATKRQRVTHANRDIFVHLMNSMPIRRIIKVLDISPSTLYDRIDFLYSQCQRFVGPREVSLLDRMDLGKRYLSVDRQKLLVNWTDRKDRKNTAFLSIATADQATGYVLGAHLNFDAEMDSEEVQRDLLRYGDQKLNRAFRRYARVWLPSDWEMAAKRAESKARTKRRAQTGAPEERLTATIANAYDAALDREDIEDGDDPSVDAKTPSRGMLLHETAVMHAHIQLITRLLHRAEKIRFFTDQESGIRAAIMCAAGGRVLNRTVDAFYVSTLKDVSIDEKRKIVSQSKRHLRGIMASESISEEAAKILLARLELERLQTIGKWGDRWFMHPIADMREPTKSVCWLTDIDPVETDPAAYEEQLNHKARLHLKATLTAVDRFFMQVRRALTVAERGVISASADRRLWFGKNAYNPSVLVKLLEMFRTYFNYCEVGEDGKTPAMRFGLAKGPVAPEDIIYFEPAAPKRIRAARTPASHTATPPDTPDPLQTELFAMDNEEAPFASLQRGL